MLRNTAYAWRQAIFHLSFLDPTDQQAALGALRTTMAKRPIAWQQLFEPAVAGLVAVIAGASFDPTGHLAGGRRFLGRSIGPHWFAPPTPGRSIRKT